MHQHQGFTFIEILISLFILAFILMGLDAMQVTALRATKAAYYASVARQQLNNMVEYLDAIPGDYSEQLLIWNKQNQAALPQGRGKIKANDHVFELAIFWGNTEAQECKKNQMGQSGCLGTTVIKIQDSL